jgi:hypothetical protein
LARISTGKKAQDASSCAVQNMKATSKPNTPERQKSLRIEKLKSNEVRAVKAK